MPAAIRFGPKFRFNGCGGSSATSLRGMYSTAPTPILHRIETFRDPQASSPEPSGCAYAGAFTTLVLKADRLSAQTLAHFIQQTLPHGRVAIAADARDALTRMASANLLITDFEPSPEENTLDLLAACAARGIKLPRILVLAGTGQPRLLLALRTQKIHGLFDTANEAPGAFARALESVANGGRYWSETILERIRRHLAAANSPAQALTPGEEVMLAVIGDGCDDATAAEILGLSPATVATVRRTLHLKLGVQHRGELVRLAAQYGYVRFTPHGVTRPGFALMMAAFRTRRRARLPAKAP